MYDSDQRKEVLLATLADLPLGIRLTTKHMLSIARNTVKLYRIDNKSDKPVDIVHHFVTADNTFGLGRLGRLVAVFLGRNSGQIAIVDLQKQNVSFIPAHQSRLRALTLSPNEELVASASEKVGFHLDQQSHSH